MCLGLGISPAGAQDAEGSNTDARMSVNEDDSGLDDEARMLYEAALVAFREQRFENALDYFERSFSLSERPVLLYNIALVADRLRRDARAIEAYEGYLAAVPDAENRAEVEERVALLRRDAAATADEMPNDPSSSALPVVLLTVGALSLGGAVAGAVWWADRADVVSQCEARGCENGETISGERDAAMVVTIAAAAAAVAALSIGLVLFLSGNSESGAAAMCAPYPGGVGCAGRF
jgi:tetratricopeptide (TPR) repeat protein